MVALTSHTCTSEADRAAALDLWLDARRAGAADPWPSLDGVYAALAGPARAQIWTDHAGALLGVAILLDESVLVWGARCGADDEVLEATMLAWALQTCREVAAGHGEGAYLFVPVLDGDGRLAALLARMGFREDRLRTLRMRRALSAPLDPPPVPAGFTIRPLAGEPELAAVTALHGAVFLGGAKSSSERRALMRAPGYRPELDLVAVTADGTLAGYALGMVDALASARLARGTGWLEYIGVDRARRQHGLGRALTLALLRAMRSAGLAEVLLSTCATNTAARHLFAQCAFTTWRTVAWYVREAEGEWRRPGC